MRGAVFACATLAACLDRGAAADRGAAPVRGDLPDVLPALTTDVPFRYPAAAYAAGVQADVLLRIFLDTTGRPVADSTRVQRSSGHAEIDSAAVTQSAALRFAPAVRDGAPVPVAVLLPVQFRLPSPLPPASRP